MTKQRDVLLALKALVAAALPLAVVTGFDADAAEPERIGPGGCAIGDPGDPGDPDVDLSPLAYNYTHQIFIDLAAPKGAAGEDLDQMLQAIGAAIVADRTLGGLCQYLDCSAATLGSRAAAAIASVNWATIAITAEYSTSTPLA